MLNRLGVTAVGEDVRDQGDALIRSERTIGKALPNWDTTPVGVENGEPTGV